MGKFKDKIIGKFKNSKLTQNVTALLALKGADYFLNFLMFPFLLRMIGPEKFGAIIFMQTIAQYFVIVTDYGFNMTAPRDIARAENENAIGKIFMNVMSAKLIMISVIFVLSAVVILNLPSKTEFDVLLFLAVMPLALGNIAFPVWFFQGIQEMKYITISSVIARSLLLVIMLITVSSPEDYLIAALLFSSMSVVSGILSFQIIIKKYKYVFVRPDFQGILRTIKDGWQIFLSTVAINLYTNTNILILGIFTNPTIVGYFGAASKLVDSIKGLMSAVTQAVYPHVSAKLKISMEDTVFFIRKFTKYYTGLFFAISFMLCLLAEPVTIILFGEDYRSSVIILRILAWLPFIISFSQVYGIQVLLNFGKQSTFSKVLIAASVFDLVMVLPLGYFFRELGVAAVMVAVEIAVSLGTFYYAKKTLAQ